MSVETPSTTLDSGLQLPMCSKDLRRLITITCISKKTHRKDGRPELRRPNCPYDFNEKRIFQQSSTAEMMSPRTRQDQFLLSSSSAPRWHGPSPSQGVLCASCKSYIEWFNISLSGSLNWTIFHSVFTANISVLPKGSTFDPRTKGSCFSWKLDSPSGGVLPLAPKATTASRER